VIAPTTLVHRVVRHASALAEMPADYVAWRVQDELVSRQLRFQDCGYCIFSPERPDAFMCGICTKRQAARGVYARMSF